ncbi:TraR/DksA family transcriptional regulator [Sphingosinicella terrae]|uniref:TraR/DksA family transcriptional regulator n=1 Tax=Sphingosinicella terrae TaxID=2172047 RepID=UPI000E0CEF38|nr:TraR/DksA C4-type zinc finger protein [Sphingosinicella terrae]
MEKDEARPRLLVRLAQLEEEARIGESDRAPVPLDQDKVGRLSRIDAMQVQAMALAAQRRRQAEKDRIAAALRRLDMDEFGACTACGEDIAEGRLHNDPSVALCIGCAGGKVEAGG